MRAIYHLIFLSLLIACNQNRGESFDNENLVLEQMGDLEKWQSLQGLYIKALHEEKRLDFPYYSEIKRNLNPTEVWIHQWTEELDNVRYFNDSLGWSLRNGDKTEMDSSMLVYLKNWDRHLFYRTIKNLATENYEAKTKNDSTFTIWDGNYFIATITLNKNGLPYKYFTPTVFGDTSLTVYAKWSETDGLVHPDVSMAPDSSFFFTAEVWTPYFESLKIDTIK
ncbi:hypothetical protein [Ekhidna sp.]|jgi:hypothetical protein|uniref:hypothetical protein n=1 Tax=Ekhidna sp. TaxID=2608089 RepID=UPI0032EDC0BF